jgi:hypothetical protein
LLLRTGFRSLAIATLAIGPTLNFAPGATLNPASAAAQSANVHPYCWNNAGRPKKCIFDDMSKCEVYAEDASG